MGSDSHEYFEQRERAERTAAKNAKCGEARRIHQELAQKYAGLGQEARQLQPSQVRRKLSIVRA